MGACVAGDSIFLACVVDDSVGDPLVTDSLQACAAGAPVGDWVVGSSVDDCVVGNSVFDSFRRRGWH